MICLTTTARRLQQCLAQVASQKEWIDAVELRIDLLEEIDLERILDFPAGASETVGRPLPAIATVRRREDGGRYPGDEENRVALLRDLGRSGRFGYIDLELDLRDNDRGRGASAAAREGGTGIVRSYHDMDGTPARLDSLLRDLGRASGEIAKLAVRPRGIDDLLRLLRAADSAPDLTKIVIGMGEYGLATRVLTARFGSLLTFASVPGEEAAPGHLSPERLAGLYRYHEIRKGWPVFGVIGSPISHSRSPQYHNRRFAEEKLSAVYLPFLVDDLRAFFELAELLPLSGVSVTIPHKEEVMRYLDSVTPEGRAARACNTAFRAAPRAGSPWTGTNTDAAGFLRPLVTSGVSRLRGSTALVLGAGGAARGVVFALLQEGCQVTVANRTVERARALAGELGEVAPGPQAVEVAEIPVDPVRSFDLIAQTTSVGMHGHGDPAPWYRFRGHEVVFDIVYTPPETPFVARAAAAGCRVITGDRMFEAQAEAQFALYRDLALMATAGA